jgi:4-hydroxybenzoate polyprenyltransferase
MVVLLALAGFIDSAAYPYYLGVVAAAVLVLYEDRLFDRAENVFVLNERIFIANMIFSLVFLATTAVSYAVR